MSLAPRFVDVDHVTNHVTAMAGSTERLSCSVVGYPVPELVWYKDGMPLSIDGQREELMVGDDGGGPTLVKLMTDLVLGDLVPADSGRYRCTAFNVHGNASFVYYLLVIGQ